MWKNRDVHIRLPSKLAFIFPDWQTAAVPTADSALFQARQRLRSPRPLHDEDSVQVRPRKRILRKYERSSAENFRTKKAVSEISEVENVPRTDSDTCGHDAERTMSKFMKCMYARRGGGREMNSRESEKR